MRGRRRAALLTMAALVALAMLCACGAVSTQGSSSPGAQASSASSAAPSTSAEASATQSGVKSTDTGASTSQPSPENPESTVTVVCIGDSITYGFGLADREAESWPALLDATLGDQWAFVNLGVSGTTLDDEGLFPYRATGNLEKVPGTHPDVVTIMLGTNDVSDSAWDAARYRQQLESIVDELAGTLGPDTQFVLMAPPPLFIDSSTGFTDICNERLRNQVREAVREVAALKGAVFVDLFALCDGHAEWFDDGVHPNAEGCAAIAGHLYREAFADMAHARTQG